jgi:probable HAF family extracellular repeat protein
VKSNKLILIAASISIIALALPTGAVAQHPRYKLVDLGTLGGPNSGVSANFLNDLVPAQDIGNNGTVAATADTSTHDPLCYFDDCFYSNAIEWKNGALTNLGTLPGGNGSFVEWVSKNGLVTGFAENGETDPINGNPEFRAVVWKKGQISDLGTLDGGHVSGSFAVNNRGQVAGFSTNGTADPFSFWYGGLPGGTQTRAFVSQNGLMQDLGTLGGPDAGAFLVNERGQIAGFSYTSSTSNSNNGSACAPNVPTQDPFLWEQGTMVDLGTLGGTCGYANALNERGQVVGQSSLEGNLVYHPFLWDKHNSPPLTDLGTFGGDNGWASWINDAGEIVVSADFPGDVIHHAGLWHQGVLTDLGTVGSDPCSRGFAINSKGQIVGGSSTCSAFVHAFLWEDGGPMVDLNTLVPTGSDLTLTEAIFINDRGEIAGNGVLSSGDTHAFLLIPCGESDDDCGDSAASTSLATQAVQIPQKANSSTPVSRDAPNRMTRGFDHSSLGWSRGSGVRQQK